MLSVPDKGQVRRRRLHMAFDRHWARRAGPPYRLAVSNAGYGHGGQSPQILQPADAALSSQPHRAIPDQPHDPLIRQIRIDRYFRPVR